MKSVFRRARWYRSSRSQQQPFFQAKGEGEYAGGETDGFFTQTPATVQPKLTIGQPNDKYEREADTMADRVVSQGSATATGPVAAPQLQTKCADCEEKQGVQRMAEEEPEVQTMPEEEEVQRMAEEEPEVQAMEEEEVQAKPEEEEVQAKPLMRKAANGRSVGTSTLATQLNSSKGGGRPMAPAVQTQMNQAFGRDFGAVRIHTGSRAAEMNQGIQAKAFTHGSDIYFNQGQYRPETTAGQRLLAHELTHTVQQGGKSRKLQPYRNKDAFNFQKGGKVGPYQEETFRNSKNQPWIKKIDIELKTKHTDANKNEFWKGTLTASYHTNGHEPTSEFSIPISGGGKDQGRSDKGNFRVSRIEGIGYNSGTFSGKFDRKTREDKHWKYTKPDKDGKRPANMHFAVFYNRGEAIHIGPLNISSHGCIHVENRAAMRLINYHSVKGKTLVNVSYTK